jgi:hypothetical protein
VQPAPATKPTPKKRRTKARKAPRPLHTAGLAQLVGARIDWASLLRRVYLVDVLQCQCGGRRLVIQSVDAPPVIAAILDHLGLPTGPPPLARARNPAFDAA